MVQKWFEYSKAAIAMVLVQLFTTGLQLLSRIVLKQGIYVFALMAYRTLVAALVVASQSFYFERDTRKKLSWIVFLLLFLNASSGMTLSMVFFNYGLRDTKAGNAVNFLNLLPVITFILSVTARLEKLGLKSRAGQLKVAGTIISTGGALTVFPYKFWATTLACVVASIQAAVVKLCIDHRLEAWKLGWNVQLGAIGTAGVFCLVSWVVATQGPAYPPMSGLVGMVLINVGLYSCLWVLRHESTSLLTPTIAFEGADAEEAASGLSSVAIHPDRQPQ